jgi:hypothetical protein
MKLLHRSLQSNHQQLNGSARAAPSRFRTARTDRRETQRLMTV